MSKTELAKLILSVLRTSGVSMMAKDVLHSLKSKAKVPAGVLKKDINSILYSELLPAGLVEREEEYRWKIATSSPPGGKSHSPEAKLPQAKTKSPISDLSLEGKGHSPKDKLPQANAKSPTSDLPLPLAQKALDSKFVVEIWDEFQKAVIEAEPEGRLLVEAGPGTGKTAVACARVANLVREYLVSESNILLVSFTRAAIAEIRLRLGAYLNDEHLAASVEVATLDSFSWKVNKGFSPIEDNSPKDYEGNISQFNRLIENGSIEIRDYLNNFKHIIIDEAQDLTGPRASLVLSLLKNLPSTCGITVFSDQAQAIYGFTVEEGSRKQAQTDFLRALPEAVSGCFKRVVFQSIYRTDSSQLQTIFHESRQFVRKESSKANEGLRQLLLRKANKKQGLEDSPFGCDNLVLHRYRRDVLNHSQDLSAKLIPHRVRMGRTPPLVHPWIGWLLGSHPHSFLNRKTFDDLWENLEMSKFFPRQDREESHKVLSNLGPADGRRIDLNKVRLRLAASRPPAEVCAPECGTTGPIIGTIHASKGREADNVVLFLPTNPTKDDDASEETRILYVGATRARKTLSVCEGEPNRAFPLDSGRLWCNTGTNPSKPYHSCRIEVGLEGDIEATAAVAAPLALSPKEARDVQFLLAESAMGFRSVVAHCSKDWNYEGYRLELADQPGKWIAKFSGDFEKDIKSIRSWFFKHSKNHIIFTPKIIKNMHIFAVQTVAVADETLRSGFHEPYRTSGFFLSPVVIGYPFTSFGKKQNGTR